MGSTIFIVWRESIEAMLVIGILYTWLKTQTRSGSVDAVMGLRYLWGGVLGGIGLALALAFIILKVQSELAAEALDYFQIAIVLIASALITQMVIWMRCNSRTLKAELENGLQQARENTNWWGMATLAAIAVGREGAETVIFVYGNGLAQNTALIPFSLAVIGGFVLAFITFRALQKGTRWFSWQLFFRISEVLLLLLAAALLMDGIERMIGLDWIPAIIDPVWDSSFILDDSSTIGSLVSAFTGYRSYPALSMLLAYGLYWLAVFWLLKRASVRPLASA